PQMAVILGNGNGTFQPNPFLITTLPSGISRVVAADFDGDSKLDLVVDQFDQSLFLLLGNGDGTFELRPSVDLPAHLFSMASADFNQDSKPDLAVVTFLSDTYTASVLIGNGDGTFQAPVTLNAFANPGYIAIADFNGDSKTDLAFADLGSLGAVTVF